MKPIEFNPAQRSIIEQMKTRVPTDKVVHVIKEVPSDDPEEAYILIATAFDLLLQYSPQTCEIENLRGAVALAFGMPDTDLQGRYVTESKTRRLLKQFRNDQSAEYPSE